MKASDREVLYRRAIEAWGQEAQERMLTEEVGELLQAVNKLWRAPENQQTARALALIQELADVAIMVEQVFVMHFGPLDGLSNAKDLKLARLAKRLDATDQRRVLRPEGR